MEDYGNGQSGILAGLDYDTVNAMKSAEKNWNDDFINGNSTNAFREYKESGNKDDLAPVGDNIAGAVAGVTNSLQLIDSIITPKLTTYVTSYVSTVVMSYMSDAMVEMLSFDGSKIISMAGQLMPNYLIDAGQIMNELLKTKESIMDEQADDMMNKLTDKINQVIGDKVKVVTDKISEQLEKVNPQIAAIAYYSQMGPVFVQSKIDLCIKKTVDTCFKGIASARDTVNKEKEKIIESISEKMAEKLANKVNDKIKQQTQEKLMQVEQKKKDAMNKIKTQIINVKLKLMALIGG